MKIPVKGKVIALLLITLAVYGNSLFSGFVWDDSDLIVKKQVFFSNPRNAAVIFAMPDVDLRSRQAPPYYRPLGTLSYMFDHYLWGSNPFWYHLENILLHALAVVLFFFLLREVFEDERLAFFSALLFSVYPVNAEAVDAIFNRNVLLCAVFSFACLLFLKKGGLKWTAFSLLSYFLALLSKEPAVVLPFFLLFFSITAAEEKFKIKWGALAAFFGVTAAYFVIRHIVLGFFTSEPGAGLSFSRLKLISSVYFEHFRLFVVPFRLNASYALSALPFRPFKAAIAGLGVITILYFSLARKRKIPSPVRAGAQWVFWGLLPVSNLIEIPSAPVAERYQYTVIPGLVLVLGYGIAALSRKRGFLFLAATIMAAISIALGARTFVRNFVWKNNGSLYLRMLDSDPDNPGAHCNLAGVYLENNELDKAMAECRTAIALDPSLAAAHLDLGVLYLKRNMNGAAELELKTAAGLNPYIADVHEYLGSLYAARNDLNGAVREFEAALALDPALSRALVNLGVAYARMGRLDDAIDRFRAACACAPDMPEAHLFLGIGYEKKGLFKEAAGEFREVLKLQPGNKMAVQNLKYLEARSAR